MILGTFIKYFRLFFADRSSRLFFIAVLIGLAFSIAVIVSTFSLMEGFEVALESGLKHSQGDVTIIGRRSFFTLEKVKSSLAALRVKEFSPLVTSEAFLVGDNFSQGVLVTGIEFKSYQQVTGVTLNLTEDEVAIGRELSRVAGLQVGDHVQLLFAAGNKTLLNTPVAHLFRIKTIIDSPIYLQSLRMVYVQQRKLQDILQLKSKINKVLVNTPFKAVEKNKHVIKNFVLALGNDLGFEFIVRPYWSRYTALLEAVKVEKFYIVAILQVIVIVSIFNIMAILLFIGEKKAGQIFLLRVLGMTNRAFARFWYQVIFLFWIGAVGISYLFITVFSKMLSSWKLFQLPGSVYHLSHLQLSLNFTEVIIIVFIVLIWMFVVTWLTLKRWNKHTLIEGLKLEL